MASVEDTLSQVNSVLVRSTDGPYSGYSCKTVSWDDVQRGTVGGELSCWGSNITDTRLYAKDGRRLFTVRGDNWNERLGRVRSEDLALVATDEDGGGGGSSGLRPVTLRTVLTNISKYGGYANLNIDSIADETLDEHVSVRFQTTFLPVEEGEKTSLEFAPEAYNYNTMDDEDPRNLVLLCTTQGLAVQQDGKGAKKLFHHIRDEHGEVKRYWLEAESSSHKVGGAQAESSEEKEDALKRGKATSAVIGTKAIGTRFNVLMTIQVPLKQKRKKFDAFFGLEDAQVVNYCCAEVAAFSDSECYEEEEDCCEDYALDLFAEASPQPASEKKSRRKSKSGYKREKTGKSSAARVSRGSEVSDGTTWNGITVEDPARHPSEHVTATIVMYYTCSGGVPSTEDVKAAIDDLEELYRSVETSGRLGDETFNFMKSELTVKDAIDIKNKLSTQPPPKPTAPENAGVFPSNDW
uniref:Uncharacterized protein n=1 Tax=Pseudictyota dubia TaxID=2749911 RepID=A0A7R9ZGH3_9STRA|mmetsp:Transcript_47110/g.87506  ORF Transcript_47110/g.87506 Transcript_47110/m.87506 type:complete len:465 (+) Transcript_47110:46-1440(+)